MTNYEKLLDEIRKLGMDYRWAKMFVKKFADDESAFQMTHEEIEWAMKRGFFPGRIKLYGLTEENFQDYLPDYNYFMTHPLNHHFKIWVNDKLSLKYTLNSNGCEDTMPMYYLYVENDNTYTYLFDAPENIKKNGEFLLNLLKEKKCLAMKPNSGTSGGRGFIKLEYTEGVFKENNKVIGLGRFEEIKDNLKNYIVTEYAYQHKEFNRIWPESECTLRVIMLKNAKNNPYGQNDWSCVVSYARFGSSVSGGASNLSSGGIGVGFDFETGKYNDFAIRYKHFCSGEDTNLYEHPDTKVRWKGGKLPNWECVRNSVMRICSHISSLCYLGFDIIITPNGMKLCEINTHPACDYEQVMCGPSLKKAFAKEFFEAKSLQMYDGIDFFQAYRRSQE